MRTGRMRIRIRVVFIAWSALARRGTKKVYWQDVTSSGSSSVEITADGTFQGRSTRDALSKHLQGSRRAKQLSSFRAARDLQIVLQAFVAWQYTFLRTSGYG